jgi:hypothetical protein
MYEGSEQGFRPGGHKGRLVRLIEVLKMVPILVEFGLAENHGWWKILGFGDWFLGPRYWWRKGRRPASEE